MEMKYIFNPLNTEEFKSRIAESFPSAYLTIISIIQGVALGLLATNSFGYIKDPCLPETWVRFLPYSFMSFLTIIVVTYEYTWFVGVFRWSPRIWDTIIPFALGFSAIGPIFYLTNPKIWWFLTAAFCGFGALGFFNTLWNCRQNMFDKNKKVYIRVRNTLKSDILIALIAALICIFAGLFYSSSMKILHWYLLEILFLISLFGIVIFLFYKEERFMKNLHSDFGFIR